MSPMAPSRALCAPKTLSSKLKRELIRYEWAYAHKSTSFPWVSGRYIIVVNCWAGKIDCGLIRSPNGSFSHQVAHSLILKTLSNSFLLSFILNDKSQSPVPLDFLQKSMYFISAALPAGSVAPFWPMGFKEISAKRGSGKAFPVLIKRRWM